VRNKDFGKNHARGEREESRIVPVTVCCGTIEGNPGGSEGEKLPLVFGEGVG